MAMDTLGTVILLLLVLMVSDIKSGNELRVVSSCGCELVVECTVTGGGATVWQGTIFDDCQNDEIRLRHSQFNISGIEIHDQCEMRRPVIGRSVSAGDGSFTSQLIVPLCENNVNGTTIECTNESGLIVGSKQIDTSSISNLRIPAAINISILPSKSIPGEMTITWDLVYDNDTLTQNVTQVYNINTSNCGMCTIVASSNFATCTLTASNLQVEMPVCNVTVMIQIIGCNSIIAEQYSADLNGLKLIYPISNNMMTTAADLTEGGPLATKNWSTLLNNDPLQKVLFVSLPLASVGILIITVVLAVIFVVVIMKRKSQRKKLITEGASELDHSDNPIDRDIMIDTGQYSLLQHPSDKLDEGVMIYLEVGPDTRVGTAIIPSADRVEYAEVKTKPQTSIIDKYLNLDTLLIQVRCQVTPLWHEFGVAAGVPMDTLNKCFNCTPEESIVEVLDYWLRQEGKTWKDVAYVLNEIHLQELSKKILKVYDTGTLPTTVVDKDIMVPEVTSEKSQSPPPPPLPPKP